MSKVEFDTNGGCWLWTGAISEKGYGRHGHENLYAHRLAYMLFNGPIPEDKPHVLHTCDVTCCVNPDHLWVGTHLDNMKDKVVKGRGNGRHTLPEDQVSEIKQLLASKELNQTEIASMYGVDPSDICRINSGKRWANVS